MDYKVVNHYKRHLDELFTKFAYHQRGSSKSLSIFDRLDVKTSAGNLPSKPAEKKTFGNGKDINARIGGLLGNSPSDQAEKKTVVNAKVLNTRIGSLRGNSIGNQAEKKTFENGKDLNTRIGSLPGNSSGNQVEEEKVGHGRDLNTRIRGLPGNLSGNQVEKENVEHGKDINTRIGVPLGKRGRSPSPENPGKAAPSPKRYRVDTCAEPSRTKAADGKSQAPVSSVTEAQITTAQAPQRISTDTMTRESSTGEIPHGTANLVVTTNSRIYSPSMAPMAAPLPHNPNEIGAEIVRARSASVGGTCVAGNEAPTPPVLVKVESGADTNLAMTLPMYPPLMVRVKVLEDRQGTSLARIEALAKEHAKDQKEARSEKDTLVERIEALEKEREKDQKEARLKEDILVERIASLERAQEKSLMAALTRITSLERELRGE